ncbi:membrane glycosyltransferase [Cribrihabitans marinus]|uniref:Glucans biosynthesis glucosyltransferase H n=1 Tax=Cribrihabitans marinus TaxID=1227549 RepID=A0A1H7B029_9RHOB|nr:glucans biosynthesis glucosyltransferase MdoH [Cribrihabitans marinus]GGH32809.1 glucans biosynthesis glucosyltransferase H [Cribrihabitans marinus]SEJ70546.1 membrane glycosyltransferase [Cribrihabitans marinus]
MSADLHIMPPRAPLPMPKQDFGRDFRDTKAPDADAPRDVALWRVLAFSPAMAATLALVWLMEDWFAEEGVTLVEGVLLALISFNFFWIAFTVSTVVLGVLSLSRQASRRPRGPVRPLRVALLMPVYNEVPWYVLGNARSMLEELRARGGVHDYAMFILSDTRDDAIAAQEQASIEALRNSLAPGLALHYRRRDSNTDRKVGNIADWVQHWGGDWDAMLVLDADSLMTGRAIAQLTDALARDPGAGLIQSFPQLIGAQTVFARMQQFANGVYGAAFAEGMARWCGQEGNYWGHNAIIRTAAFASCAGLPRLRSRSGRDRLIMSHDFVEAGLLRRAGWTVRFLPRIRGSYEETPPTLIDHIQRDRRWCQGNLQHLNLLRARGFRSISRFHLFHGAIGYLMSPIWFALLLMWALIGRSEEASVLNYFSPANPLFPQWPEMTEARHLLVIALIYGMLLAPKILGIAALPLTGARYADFGGAWRFAISFLTELVLSVLYAPILMVQQVIAVGRTVLGLQRGWSPQARQGGRYGLGTLAVCHALETVIGLALSVGILAGLVSPWLLPIAFSLALAVPLSALSGVSAQGARRLLQTREEVREPAITRAARSYRRELKAVLDGDARVTPAE